MNNLGNGMVGMVWCLMWRRGAEREEAEAEAEAEVGAGRENEGTIDDTTGGGRDAVLYPLNCKKIHHFVRL